MTRNECADATPYTVVYVAEKHGGQFSPASILLSGKEGDSWMPPEADPMAGRYTTGNSIISLDESAEYHSVEVECFNYAPMEVPVTLRCGDYSHTETAKKWQKMTLRIPLPKGRRLLSIESATFVPKRCGIGVREDRLGIAVTGIGYRKHCAELG